MGLIRIIGRDKPGDVGEQCSGDRFSGKFMDHYLPPVKVPGETGRLLR